MAYHEIETQWMGKMQFNASVMGHTITMDAPVRAGGEDDGPIPKPLILTALSGCSGMDVIALLRKQDIYVDDLNMKLHGELSKSQPMEYISVHMIYEFKGAEAHKWQAAEAVNTSQEKICGVSSMLKKIMPVTWEIVYNNALLFTNAKREDNTAQLLSVI